MIDKKYLYFLPFSLLIRIELVGRLHGIEIALLGIVVYKIVTEGIVLNKTTFYILSGLLAWFIMSVISDIYNVSEFNDLARGWSRIIFFSADIIALYIILDNERKWFVFIVASLIAFTIEKSQESEFLQTYWKFGVGLYIPLLLSVLTLYKNRFNENAHKNYLVIVWGICLIVSLILNCRNLAAGQLVAIMMISQFSTPYQNSLAKKIVKMGVFVPALIICVSTYALLFGYGYAAESGYMGEEAQKKILTQRIGGFDPVVGLLFGGRSEIFASGAAIRDAPFVGHGSWAKGEEYVKLYKDTLIYFADSGINDVYMEDEVTIPTHSHILGAWVDSGIIGALFWFFVIVFLINSLRRAFFITTPSARLFTLVVFFLFWDILFSPFGALGRFWWALMLQPPIHSFYVSGRKC